MNMEKHKKWILLGCILLVISIFMALSTVKNNRASILENAFNTVFTPIQKGATGISDGIGGFFGFMFEMKDYKQVNDELTSKVAKLESQYRSAEDYRKENEELRALLDIKQEAYTAYESTGAKIIGWSSDNWYNTYTIDKGSMDGISVHDTVLTELGLIGRVQEVGLNWARVVTIVDASSTVGATVVRTGDVAMVDGDLELGKDGLCRLSFINKQSEIVVGDMLETSGLGNVFAPGIPIGRVTELHADTSGIDQYAIIEPAIDFENVRYVLVLKMNQNGSNGQ